MATAHAAAHAPATSSIDRSPLGEFPAASSGIPGLGALLTVAEVAAYLRVSEMTVYRLITAGEVSATKIGRGWRIAAADLADYVADQRVPRAS